MQAHHFIGSFSIIPTLKWWGFAIFCDTSWWSVIVYFYQLPIEHLSICFVDTDCIEDMCIARLPKEVLIGLHHHFTAPAVWASVGQILA
jgi:hypothetical protein